MSLRSSGVVFFALFGLAGCATAEVVEEQKSTTEHLDQSGSDASLEIGSTLTLRLSAGIRADLLPHARVGDLGPYQSITYGEPTRILVIENRGFSCEVRGSRPQPSASEKYFPPVLPNPLHLSVMETPLRTAGVTAFLRSEPDDNDTTWSVDCVKAGDTDRTATLSELRSAFDSGSYVGLD